MDPLIYLISDIIQLILNEIYKNDKYYGQTFKSLILVNKNYKKIMEKFIIGKKIIEKINFTPRISFFNTYHIKCSEKEAKMELIRYNGNKIPYIIYFDGIDQYKNFGKIITDIYLTGYYNVMYKIDDIIKKKTIFLYRIKCLDDTNRWIISIIEINENTDIKIVETLLRNSKLEAPNNKKLLKEHMENVFNELFTFN